MVGVRIPVPQSNLEALIHLDERFFLWRPQPPYQAHAHHDSSINEAARYLDTNKIIRYSAIVKITRLCRFTAWEVTHAPPLAHR